MGIYGDMMMYFPEQFVSIEYFNMTPKHNAGYTIVDDTITTVRVIQHNVEPNQVEDANGNLVVTANFQIWTRTKLTDGWFVRISDEIYRLKASNDWYYLGGFYKFNILKVVGDDGQLTNDITPNLGEGSFS
jgi:hypothetical protein